jgi:hypothetical protein
LAIGVRPSVERSAPTVKAAARPPTGAIRAAMRWDVRTDRMSTEQVKNRSG